MVIKNMMLMFPDGEPSGTVTALAFCRAEPYLAGKDDMSLHGLYNTVKRKLIRDKRKEHREAQPLRIDGCKTHLTPEPDDAELAAQALLETIVSEECRVKSEESATGRKWRRHRHTDHARAEADTHHDAAYYRDLAEHIREAHAQEARRTKRYLAYAEEKLRTGGQLTTSELAEIERGLYPLQDCIEREGGELKRRWQHVLAEVIVRQMNAAGEELDDGEAAMASQQTEPGVITK